MAEALPKHVFRYVEGELFRYQRLKRRAHYLYGLAVAGGGVSDVGPVKAQGGDGIDTAMRRAHADDELQRIEQRIARIEDGMDALTEEQKQLVDLRYFRRRAVSDAAEEMNVSVRTFYRIRQSVVEVVADCLEVS